MRNPVAPAFVQLECWVVFGTPSSHSAVFLFSVLVFRLNAAHSRKALRNSRIVSQKDDVHVCIMCLRAIMNYQVTVKGYKLGG